MNIKISAGIDGVVLAWRWCFPNCPREKRINRTTGKEYSVNSHLHASCCLWGKSDRVTA